MGRNRRSLLPPALLLLSQVARCYLPPEGPDLRTARIVEPGEYPGAHADLLAVRTCPQPIATTRRSCGLLARS